MDGSLASWPSEVEVVPIGPQRNAARRGASSELRLHAERLKSLVAASADLLTPASMREATERIADALTSVLGATHLSVHVLDPSHRRFQTLAQRGTAFPETGDVADLSPAASTFIGRAWTSGGPPGPIVVPDPAAVAHPSLPLPAGLGCTLVLPLTRGRDLFGFVLVALAAGQAPSPELLDLSVALAAHIAVAVDRAQLSEQAVAGAQLTRALMALDGADDEDPRAWLALLRERTPAALGFEITDVHFYRGSRAHFESAVARRLWHQWRLRRTRPSAVADGELVHAPVWGTDRALGILTATLRRGPLDRTEVQHLESIASALGEVADRRRLRDAVVRLDRQLAMHDERTHVVSELAQQLDDVFGAIVQLSDAEATTAPGAGDGAARRLSLLAREGRARLRRTAECLDALGYDPAGFEASLSTLIDRFSPELGVAADLQVVGEHRELPELVERTLLRVLHEALVWLQPGARSTSIAVHLLFFPDAVELSVRDDGAGFDVRQHGPVASGPYLALRNIRERVVECRGALHITWPEPRGLLITARIPA